ncbi:MAG: glycosyltransferase family 39 protein [Planctomycetaceae bacterium]
MDRTGSSQSALTEGRAIPRNCRRWLMVVLGLALALRVGAACGLQWMLDTRFQRQFLIEGDSNGYWELGQKLAQGEDYAIYTPPRRILRMPGFPLILAMSQALFGDEKLPARLLLALVGTTACWGVWRLGRELCDDKIGLMAAALAAVSPALVGFTPVILSETPFAATMTFSLIAGSNLLKRHRLLSTKNSETHTNDGAGGGGEVCSATAGKSLVVGLLIALAVYFRPSWLLAGIAFGGILLLSSRSPRRALRDTLLIHLGLLLGLLPWTVRNYQVSGRVVLTSLWMGPSLYDGWNPDATGDSDMRFFDRDDVLGQGMSEYDMNQHYSKLAFDFARNHPGRVVELAALKSWRYWKPWPNAAQFEGALPAIVLSTFYLPMLLLAIHGGWLMRRELWKVLIAAGPIVYFAALHAVFVSSLRYRLPAEYPMLVLSAVSLRHWCRGCCSGLCDGSGSMTVASLLTAPAISSAKGDSGNNVGSAVRTVFRWIRSRWSAQGTLLGSPSMTPVRGDIGASVSPVEGVTA